MTEEELERIIKLSQENFGEAEIYNEYGQNIEVCPHCSGEGSTLKENPMFIRET